MSAVIRALAATALIALSCASFAQVTQQAGGYKFRLKLYKGEKLNFKIPFTIEGLEKPYHLQFGMSLKVLSVTRNGLATVKSGKLNTGAMNLPGFSANGGTFTVDQRGRVEAEGGSITGFCIQYPADPVQIGGHFVATIPIATGGSLTGSVQEGQATFTLVDIVGHGKTRAARLTFKVAGNRAPSGSILVRLEDGVIDKYFTKFSASMPGSKDTDAPIKVSATVQRQ